MEQWPEEKQTSGGDYLWVGLILLLFAVGVLGMMGLIVVSR